MSIGPSPSLRNDFASTSAGRLKVGDLSCACKVLRRASLRDRLLFGGGGLSHPEASSPFRKGFAVRAKRLLRRDAHGLHIEAAVL